MGAGLVPYNKYKIFSRLKAPSVSDTPDITQQQISTPKNPRQLHSFLVQTEVMMKSEKIGELAVKTIRTLAKLSLQEQAMGAVVKKRLKMKNGHKKSRIRLQKVNMSDGILITNEEIDQLKLELEQRETLATEKQLRAEAKKSLQGKKKLAIPRSKKQKKVSFVSVESIEFHILTDTETEDQAAVPLASTSRPGRAIRPSKRLRESLNEVPVKAGSSVVPSLTMVTRSRGSRE
ncbi:hypothetical protein GP486_002874 [Trichoglossum hirsutum]|uniref:Uncharacterized protein n=1 Tax=Trichoglossum hirsutum TaxID=265104 RepID=A0A9P8LE47_9PEZI|nr:hypothetical protein GP486_002874 [Trichoglossum hirsutum]